MSPAWGQENRLGAVASVPRKHEADVDILLDVDGIVPVTGTCGRVEREVDGR